MLQVSDIFSGINEDAGIFDLQTALKSQGMDLQEGFEIPIYDIAYLKLAPDCNPGIVCSNMTEYTALDKLQKACGVVCCTINLLKLDILTLLGIVCCYIPSGCVNGGMYLFVKNNIPDLVNITEDIAVAILNLSGAKIEDLGASTMTIDVASKALDIVINLLIKMLNTNMNNYGVAVYEFNKVEVFIQQLIDSGDYIQMYNYRKNNNLINPGGSALLGGGSLFCQ